MLGSIGKSAITSDGRVRNAIDIFKDLAESMKDMTDTQKQTNLSAMFGKIGMTGASAILKNVGKDLEMINKQVKESQGLSEKSAGFQRGTLLGSFRSLMSAIEGVTIASTDMNRGAFKESIDTLTKLIRLRGPEWAEKFGKALLFMVRNAKPIMKWAGVILGIVVAMKALAVTLSVVSGLISLVNVLMLANPVVLIILGVFALIAALGALIVWWEDLIPVIEFFGEVAVNAFNIIFWPMNKMIDGATRLMKAWKPLENFMDSLAESMIAVVDAIEAIAGAQGTATKALAPSQARAQEIQKEKRERVGSNADLTDEEAMGLMGDNAMFMRPDLFQNELRQLRRGSAQQNNSTVTIQPAPGTVATSAGPLGPGVTVKETGDFD